MGSIRRRPEGGCAWTCLVHEAGLGLKPDSLRLWHLVAVGLAFQSLALVVYLNVGFIEQTAGPVAPVFLLVTLISIPTAISFAVMSNRRPSAGTAFTWLWETTVPPVGLWLGWLMASAYAMASILQPVMFGLFFNALLRFLGIPTSLATAVLGGLGVTVNGLVPLLGIAIDGYVIYYAFFRTLLSLPFKQGSSIVWVGVAWELLGICWMAVVWPRRPAARREEPLVTTVD